MQLALHLPNPLAAREVLFLSTDGQPFTHVPRRRRALRQAARHGPARHQESSRRTARSGVRTPQFCGVLLLNEQNKPQPEYRLTHDGFAFLAMRFTGAEAMAWQIAFLQAFNAIEAELRAKTERFAHALDQVRPMLRPVVECTEAGYSRADIAAPLGKSPAAITYHRRAARRLGLLAA